MINIESKLGKQVGVNLTSIAQDRARVKRIAIQAQYNADVKQDLGFKAVVKGREVTLQGRIPVQLLNGLVDKGYKVYFNEMIFTKRGVV